MNREQILELWPGYRIDALVAEHIMGWKKFGVRPDGSHNGWETPDFGYTSSLTAYSSIISAAWQVADKLKIAIIPQSPSAPDHLKYLARADWDFKHEEINVFAATAPEAICKAALIATLDPRGGDAE